MTIVTLIACVAMIPAVSNAQMSAEIEIGTDALGEGFLSEYLYYDFPSVNLLARLFWVNRVLTRVEFAAGPTFTVNDNPLKFQFGWSTDGEVMAACVVSANVWNGALYIADAKVSTRSEIPTTVYQKACLGLIRDGALQCRIEMLTVTRDVSFLRLGVEYQTSVSFAGSGKGHVYGAPFYDPIRSSFGGQIGVRLTP